MKKIFIAIILLQIFCGCQNEIKQASSGFHQISGTWISKEENIEIVITNDGKLHEAVITPGLVRVKPNHITEVELKNGSIGIYDIGKCFVQYIPQSRELLVEINVERLFIPFPDDKVEGFEKHVFQGFLNSDYNIWEATWFDFFDYGPRFPMDPNGVGIPIFFEKKDS